MSLMRPGLLLLAALLVATPAWAGNDCVTLAFQGNVGGKIEDCGCPKKPLGGLAHRAAKLSEIAEGCGHTLFVDAGNLLGTRDFEGGLAQTEFLLQESQQLGYRVQGVGARELGFGYEFARSLQDEYGLQLVASNLLRDGQPAFAPTHVEQIGELRIGFLSLLASSELPEGFTLADPKQALLERLPQLRADSDVIVLLSNLERGATRALLEALPASHGIDFAIEGQTSDHWERPFTINGTTLVAANSQGKYLGELALTLADGQWTGDAQYSLHALSIEAEPDRELLGRVERFVKERDALATSAGTR